MKKISYTLVLARIICVCGLTALFLVGLGYAYAEVIVPGGVYQGSGVASTTKSDPKEVKVEVAPLTNVVATPVFDQTKTYIHSGGDFSAAWNCSTPLSEIQDFLFAIGTTPGGTQTTGYMMNGGWLPISQSKLISGKYRELVDGQTYYFSVKAKNNAGVESAVATSRGIVAGG